MDGHCDRPRPLEKARVVLAELVLGQYNTLFLDEPTNHLDIETAHALIESLQSFAGCILLVSHDRLLIEKVSTHLGRISNTKLEIHEGIQQQWLQPQTIAPQKVSTKSKKSTFQEERKRANQRKKKEKQVAQLESDISNLEARQSILDEELIAASTDYEKVQALAKKQQEVDEQLMMKMEQWEMLSLELDED